MKAIVCHEFSALEDLSLEDITAPQPGPGEVLIDVKAAGINFPDLLTVRGLYQFKPSLPFTPGTEVSGIVAGLGEGVDSVQVGDKVFGTLHIGGYAEQAVVHENDLIPMGERMSFEQAAGFTVTYGTSWYALKQRARLQAGETMLVLGAAGGVGIASIQLAKTMGATVIAAASSAEKLDFACQAGADERINYSTEDLKLRTKALTGGRGADVVYDPVGGDYSEQAFRATAWDGRFLVIGFASGRIPKMPLNLALLKGASLVGVFWGGWKKQFPQDGRRDLLELVAMIDRGDFSPPVGEIYPLEQFQDALRCISERHAQGKVILSMA